jgi:NitT/TauT family transport system permease protein
MSDNTLTGAPGPGSEVLRPTVPPPSAGRGRKRVRRLLTSSWFTTPVLFAVFLLVWKLYVELFDVSRFVLPPPEVIGRALVEAVQDPQIWRHTRITLVETLAGFGIALVGGIALGALLGKVRWLDRMFRPFIVALQVVPKVALVPLFIMWFGFGMSSKIVIAAVLAIFPILTNTLLGVKSVSRGHLDVMTSLNATRWQTFRQVEFPSATPYVLAGMEMGIVFATIGAVVGEFLGGSEGLGFRAVSALNSLQVETLFAVVTILTVMGLLLYAAVVSLRRYLIPWHESVRGEEE